MDQRIRALIKRGYQLIDILAVIRDEFPGQNNDSITIAYNNAIRSMK
jgi:hypothetical protein